MQYWRVTSSKKNLVRFFNNNSQNWRVNGSKTNLIIFLIPKRGIQWYFSTFFDHTEHANAMSFSITQKMAQKKFSRRLFDISVCL